MWKVTIKGLLAHKLRMALTALAIVLGVTFIAGTFVLTDTLNNTFTTLFGNIYQHIDFEVRAVAAFNNNTNQGGGAVRRPISQSVLSAVRTAPGVSYAEGTVSGYAQFVGPDGKAIVNGGAPTFGLSFDPNPQLSSLHLAQGRAPTGPHDVLMDLGTAEKHHFRMGMPVHILLAGPAQTFTITGFMRFGTANNLAGATIAAFTLPEAQSIFDKVGQFDAIDALAAPGTSKPAVQHAIAQVLPHGVEVVTGQTVANEQTNDITKALGIFSTALLVFAFISLFVGGFTIFNSFSIIVGQRTRELALLRIVGASRRQVFRSVLLEAAVVGLLASLVGIVLGVLAALGLEALLSGFGLSLPSGSLVFAPRTVIVSLIVGLGVTLVAAVSPARRSVRIPPVAALVAHEVDTSVSSRRRLLVGSTVVLAGIVALAVGLTAPAIQLVGLGAVGIFVGVGMLAPFVARPMASVLGRPVARVFATAGKLGRENSMRSPRRTAQSASALVVGLALVSAMAVFGASLSRSATSSVDNAISSQLIITSSNNNGQGTFSRAVSSVAAGVPGVTRSANVFAASFEFQHSVVTLVGLSVDHLADTVILRMRDGTTAALAQGQLLIDTNTADSKHLSVGSEVPVDFARTGPGTLRIGGIYKANALIGGYVVGDQFFESHFDSPLPIAVLLHTTGPVSTVKAAVSHALDGYPGLKIQTRQEFEDAQKKQVNQLLSLVYALLFLAVLIALFGIVNTLMLSVFERTREIGLLRAVGMGRRQVRMMIRSESIILSLFGAVIGIVVGTALGVALSASLK
ncbi:MAG TPA: FtsX-like permease family protein, partial [Acidimicrobiales bacterium]|nr:FtsX-like permease family protein [Acidimicrobiales bacterium]